MSVREDKNILIQPIHIEFRLVLHRFKKQRCEIICTSQRPARVSTLYPMYHPDDVAAHLACNLLKVAHICLKSAANLSFIANPGKE